MNSAPALCRKCGVTLPPHLQGDLCPPCLAQALKAQDKPPADASTTARDQPARSMNFKLLEPIGRGGMGVVYAAADHDIGRTVAVKQLREDRQDHPEAVARFMAEARITGQLEHPGIVPVYEVSQDAQGRPFYAMRRIKGITLARILDNIKQEDAGTSTQYPLAALLTIFQKVCDAIAYAHSLGVIHRDLKPENVMVGEFGEVVMMDWGLAKVMQKSEVRGQKSEVGSQKKSEVSSPGVEARPEMDTPADVAANVTMPGALLGTPVFMAPEQAEGRVADMDERTDIFALGGILYGILTLRPPAAGTTPAEILENVRQGNITPPTGFNQPRTGNASQAELLEPPSLAHCPGGKIPESLSAVAMKALARRPEERYQTVKDLQQDIIAYQTGFATSAERADFVKLAHLFINRHKAATATVATILLLVIGFLVKIVASEQKARARLDKLKQTAPVYCAQARTAIEEKNFREALDKIEYALQLKPEAAEYHALRGNILQSLLRLKEAREAYQQALHLNPSYTPAVENMKLCEKLLAKAKANLSPAELEELRLAMLHQGRSAEAVAIGTQITADEQKSIAFWQSELEKVGLKGILTQRATGGLKLELSGPAITNLSFPKGFPLSSLHLVNTLVTNLTPLGDLRLTSIDLIKTIVTDLSPLKGMPLTSFVLDNLNFETSKIADISPLKGMPLRFCKIVKAKVTDLSPLKGMPLKELILQDLPVADLSPLRGMSLTTINLIGLKVTDLDPLAGMPLTDVSIFGSPVMDISPLKGMRLRRLDAYGIKVTNISALQGMPLQELNLHGSKVADLSPLWGMSSLGGLGLSGTQVDDLTPLKGMKIGLLLLSGTKVADLSPLEGMPLGRLLLDSTQIKNINSLKGMPLNELQLDNTKISDLSPLKSMPIEKLRLDGCTNVDDFSPLLECKYLKYLTLPFTAKNIEPLRQHPRLQRIGYSMPDRDFWERIPTTAAEFWKAYDAQNAKRKERK